MNLGANSNFISRVRTFVLTACVNGMLLSVPTPPETFTTLRGALDGVAAKYQIQYGFESAVQNKDLQQITLDLSAKSVDTVLNQLVNQKPDYVWFFADNVYDVYPKSNPDSILDVWIHKFTMIDRSSKEAADLFGQLPEIKEWLTSHSVSRREFEVCAWSCGQSFGKLVTVSLQDVTFRTVLNTLVREFENLDWMAGRFGDNQEYIGIYLDELLPGSDNASVLGKGKVPGRADMSGNALICCFLPR